MLEIWWIRHGSTDWNSEKRWQGQSNVPLNEAGRNQARALAKALEGIPFAEVWSSDLQRCIDTASLALPYLGKTQELKTDSRLREINMGIAEGKIWSELTAQQQQSIADWWENPYELPFPGTSESLRDTASRAEAWRKELRTKDGRVAAFTHGGLIRTIFMEVVGAPSPKKRWAMELGNTGIVKIRYDGDFPILTAFNELTHIKNAWNLPPGQDVPGSRRKA